MSDILTSMVSVNDSVHSFAENAININSFDTNSTASTLSLGKIGINIYWHNEPQLLFFLFYFYLVLLNHFKLREEFAFLIQSLLLECYYFLMHFLSVIRLLCCFLECNFSWLLSYVILVPPFCGCYL